MYRISKLRATHSRERDTKHAYSNLRLPGATLKMEAAAGRNASVKLQAFEVGV
jgi:hypothetical protein|tara:strand:+ start:220 stop:378 length:159 start_codon:yes stop_codon:yes gene_type:complete